MSSEMTHEYFQKCIEQIATISNGIGDTWTYQTKENCENGSYLTKKSSEILAMDDAGMQLIAMFEYHVAFNVNYGVPILCFNAWKQDGSLLQLEEYLRHNGKLKSEAILETLTQLDHPVLCRPFLTLHPCKTRELLGTFQSKNLVISWLSVVGPYLNLILSEEYAKFC